jgi:phosphatidylserine decarboxylase
MHDCFTRELREGTRPLDSDPAALVSPCDAVVGASGRVVAGSLVQAKGLAYALDDLLLDAELAMSRQACACGWGRRS